MQLLTVFLIVALSIIATTLIIISIKLTDLVTETKASRIAVQNIEADDLFQQGYFSEQHHKIQQNHNAEVLSLIQRIELQLSPKPKAERPRSNILSEAESPATSAPKVYSNSRM
jgi:hypothetical protein